MHRCPFCKFVSDPRVGIIYDDRFPCPRCRKHPKTHRLPSPEALPQKPAFTLGELSVSSRITSTCKLIGYLTAFGYAQKKLYDISKAQTDSSKKLKQLIGSQLPTLNKASYFIPAFAIPHAVTLVTNQEWPILATAYDLAVAGLVMKTISDPLFEGIDGQT